MTVTKMRKESKILIICCSIAFLGVIGYAIGADIEKDTKYSMKDLTEKYHTIIDLKYAVDSGELDYDKLPIEAKSVLDKFNQSKEPKIIEVLP